MSVADALAGVGRRTSTGSTDGSTGLSESGKQGGVQAGEKTGTAGKDGTRQTDSNAKGRNGEPLSAEETDQVRELKKRDKEVRAHEQAHLAAGGQYARSSAKFEFTTGPDGGRYATGGEVSIDASPVSDDPGATIRKMNVVKQAALAPAQPSGQDFSVAAKAENAANEARQEMQRQTAGKLTAGGGNMQSGAKGTNLDKVV